VRDPRTTFNSALPASAELPPSHSSRFRQEIDMHQIIYIVGLIVVVLAILSFFGLR